MVRALTIPMIDRMLRGLTTARARTQDPIQLELVDSRIDFYLDRRNDLTTRQEGA